jgi:hypothetical protein
MAGNPMGSAFFPFGSVAIEGQCRSAELRPKSYGHLHLTHALPEKKNDCYDAYSDLLDDLLV